MARRPYPSISIALAQAKRGLALSFVKNYFASPQNFARIRASCGDCSSVGRVPDCDSGCRGFEPHQSPQLQASSLINSHSNFWFRASSVVTPTSGLEPHQWSPQLLVSSLINSHSNFWFRASSIVTPVFLRLYSAVMLVLCFVYMLNPQWI